MLLVKSCKKTHHVVNGTLRLGSLYEYRHTEIKYIADNEEGLMRFNINLRGPIKIPNKWANTLFSGNIVFGDGDYYRFPGRSSTEIGVIRQNYTNKTHTEFGDTSVTITRETLNSFIFCMSAVSSEIEAATIFPEYDTYWSIAEQNIKNFAVAIASSLRKEISLSRTNGNHVIPQDIDIEAMTIKIECGEVKYKNREINIHNNTKFALGQLYNELNGIEFVKPPEPFSKEKEFRFKFLFHIDGKIVTPLTNSIIIDSSDLMKYIEQ